MLAAKSFNFLACKIFLLLSVLSVKSLPPEKVSFLEEHILPLVGADCSFFSFLALSFLAA